MSRFLPTKSPIHQPFMLVLFAVLTLAPLSVVTADPVIRASGGTVAKGFLNVQLTRGATVPFEVT